jgi:hypothetical protein
MSDGLDVVACAAEATVIHKLPHDKVFETLRCDEPQGHDVRPNEWHRARADDGSRWRWQSPEMEDL